MPQPRQRLVFGWASDRKLKQMASQAANGLNMYAMWQKGWTESEVCACNLNMWNSFLCLSFVVEKWFLFIGKQTCHFLLVDFLFILFQPFGEARQRKGKVPNNPPDIDVDLPVRAWWFFLIQMECHLKQWFEATFFHRVQCWHTLAVSAGSFKCHLSYSHFFTENWQTSKFQCTRHIQDGYNFDVATYIQKMKGFSIQMYFSDSGIIGSCSNSFRATDSKVGFQLA